MQMPASISSRKKVSGVYAIVCSDGRAYVGSSSNLRKRFHEHRGSLRRGDHANTRLQSACDELGIESLTFTVLNLCVPAQLREMEQATINGMNPSCNVERTVGKLLLDLWSDPDWRAKSVLRTSQQNRALWAQPAYREAAIQRLRSQSAEAKQRASERLSERWRTDAEYVQSVRATASKVLRARFQDPLYRAKHGRRVSAFLKSKLSTKEARDNQSKHLLGIHKKPIMCVTTGAVFESLADGASAMGISVSVVNKQMRGLPTRSGLQWRFLNASDGS